MFDVSPVNLFYLKQKQSLWVHGMSTLNRRNYSYRPGLVRSLASPRRSPKLSLSLHDTIKSLSSFLIFRIIHHPPVCRLVSLWLTISVLSTQVIEECIQLFNLPRTTRRLLRRMLLGFSHDAATSTTSYTPHTVSNAKAQPYYVGLPS